MTDIEKLFQQMTPGLALTKMKIDNCPINVYYGLSEEGNYRLAFLTENPPIIIDSTAHLKVTQWAECENVYWTVFELLIPSAKQVYFVLCDNLIKTILGCRSEEIAMSSVKNRFTSWKKLFKNPSSDMTEELYKGLFGELYFLKKWMLVHYSSDVAVNAWSGPDKTSKDYSVGTDWYEVKTVSTNSETVKITSLTQLDSSCAGKLILVKTEKMSKEYDDGECSVEQLLAFILNKISDETIKDAFIEKIANYGYNFENSNTNFHKYRVSSLNFYRVDESFPKITHKEVPYNEVVKIQYELSISGLEKYLEGEK